MSDMTTVNFEALYTMLKGEPGTWKSSTALTYPGPQYWFSFDRKMRALAKPMIKHGIDPKSITYDDYNSWTMHGENNRASALKKLETLVGSCPFRTVIFDSVSLMADAMLRQILENKVNQQRSSGEKAGKFIGGIDVSEIEDFNAEAAGLNEFMGLSKDLQERRNVNVIIIAHVIRVEQKDLTGKVNISRSIVTAAKKPAAKIPAICDEAYQFNIKPSHVIGQSSGMEVFTVNNTEDYARTTLPLADTMTIDLNTNFYKTYIGPAIEKMKGK